MNEPTDIPAQLGVLHQRLGTVEGVRAVASASQLTVEFKGRPIGNWVPSGMSLTGAFVCEAALLCADSGEEAFRLTLGRLS
jgi:hypothetical protein